MVIAAMKVKDTYSLEGKVILLMTNLDSVLKSRNFTLSMKVHLVKAMVFPVVMYGCENWNPGDKEEKGWTGTGTSGATPIWTPNHRIPATQPCGLLTGRGRAQAGCRLWPPQGNEQQSIWAPSCARL